MFSGLVDIFVILAGFALGLTGVSLSLWVLHKKGVIQVTPLYQQHIQRAIDSIVESNSYIVITWDKRGRPVVFDHNPKISILDLLTALVIIENQRQEQQKISTEEIV